MKRNLKSQLAEVTTVNIRIQVRPIFLTKEKTIFQNYCGKQGGWEAVLSSVALVARSSLVGALGLSGAAATPRCLTMSPGLK